LWLTLQQLSGRPVVREDVVRLVVEGHRWICTFVHEVKVWRRRGILIWEHVGIS